MEQYCENFHVDFGLHATQIWMNISFILLIYFKGTDNLQLKATSLYEALPLHHGSVDSEVKIDQKIYNCVIQLGEVDTPWWCNG